MPTILQINTTCNSASHGKIAESIGLRLLKEGWTSYIAYGRGCANSQSESYKICSNLGLYKNALLARVFDNDGFCFGDDTEKLISYIDNIRPDIIQLHNLHGYYLNIESLFKYISRKKIAVVWTLHDCWAMTGHCSHFEQVGCEKWKTGCFSCKYKQNYPSSFFLDASNKHYTLKKQLFNQIENLYIVTPSIWLSNIVKQSILGRRNVEVIHNGVNLSIFHSTNSKLRKQYNLQDKFIILGVPSLYSLKENLNEFIRLGKIISDKEIIVLIGLRKEQIKKLPPNIIGIERTKNLQEMVGWYSEADVFFNPTMADTFPTTNLEALACGTPIITYKTGGSVESVSQDTGFIVDQKDVTAVRDCLKFIKMKGKNTYKASCVNSAKSNFSENNSMSYYVNLYKTILNN